MGWGINGVAWTVISNCPRVFRMLLRNLFFHSIHPISNDFPFFIISSSVPFFTILHFPRILPSTRISPCSFTIWSPIFPFSYILASIRPSVCTLTISFPTIEFTYILISFPFPFSISNCSLTMIFPILPFPYICTFTYVTSYKKNSYKKLSLTLFEKIPLKQLLENKHYMIHIHEYAIQLNLFNNLTGH